MPTMLQQVVSICLLRMLAIQMLRFSVCFFICVYLWLHDKSLLLVYKQGVKSGQSMDKIIKCPVFKGIPGIRIHR